MDAERNVLISSCPTETRGRNFPRRTKKATRERTTNPLTAFVNGFDHRIRSLPLADVTEGGGEMRGKNPSLNEPEGVASCRAWQEANSDLRIPSDGCMKHPSLSKKGNVFIEAANTKEEIAQVAFPLRHQRIRRPADDPECKRMTPRSSLRPHTRVGMAGPTAEGVPRCSIRRDP